MVKVTIRKTHLAVFVFVLALGFVVADVNMNEPYHSAEQVRVDVGGGTYKSLQEAVDEGDLGAPTGDPPGSLWQQSGNDISYTDGRVGVGASPSTDTLEQARLVIKPGSNGNGVSVLGTANDPRIVLRAGNAGIFWLYDTNGARTAQIYGQGDSFILPPSGAGFGIGIEDPETELHVVGEVRADNVLKTFVGATTFTSAGDMGGSNGYAQADGICDSEYPGSRVCTSADFANGQPTESGWYNTFISVRRGDGRIANDCTGWSSNDGSLFQGMYWSGSGPNPASISCSSDEPFLCCR